MPISNQQWHVSIGLASASQLPRICVTRQPKRKLTPWDILVFALTILLGAILLLGDGGIGMEQTSKLLN